MWRMNKSASWGIGEGKLLDRQETLIMLLKTRFGSSIFEKDEELIKSCDDLVRLKSAIEVLLSADNKDVVLSKIR